MLYVFDTSSFIVLSHYFPDRFPTFWERFNEFSSSGRIISVKEVYKELDNHVTKTHLRDWMENNKKLFLAPSSEETEFVEQIFSNTPFQTLIKAKQRLVGNPVADPFVIAAAYVRGACVVTEESKNESAIRIPNVCEHYGIDCANIESMMTREGWEF